MAESNDGSSNDNITETPAENGETSAETANLEASADGPVKDCWDEAVIPPSKSGESAATASTIDEEKEKLQPGDHVTRWEMLPIAWPIQVHGIVLNVHEGTVVLVDFGLSAAATDKTKGNDSNNEPDAKDPEGGEQAASAAEEKPAQPKTKQLEQAIRNFKIGGMKREKNRLNINVLTDPKDIAKWKKVNYETSWFGGGSSSKKEDGEKKAASPSKARAWMNRMATSVKERTGPGISNLRQRIRNSGGQGVHTTPSIEATESTASEVHDADSAAASQTAADDQPDTITPATSTDTSPDLEPAVSQESNLSDLKSTSSAISEGSNPDFTGRSMNPKMKELLQKKQEENPPKTMNPAMAKLLKKKEEMSAYEKKKKESLAKLPKADPAKLVLARTHWLLEHGESVLPPYHAFSSNSECLAVFCKTGRWNTLQADVFLHSTAIGNAKTMGATTIAVAASAPLLAPAVAIAGIGAVAAPWLYLNKQKNKAVDSQQMLNDAFWAQAEPEVFVACIQAWSKELLGLEEDEQPATAVENATEEAKEESKEPEAVVQQI